MTIDQIKAELRRSACEDAGPILGVSIDAFLVAVDWRSPADYGTADTWRTFFLLVAEAIE